MKNEARAFAEKINGRSIGQELTKQDESFARENGIVVIFGASDDLAEIGGAISDEVSVFDGGVVAFYKGDLLRRECDNDGCPHEVRMLEKSIIVNALWCAKDKPSWSYETDIPHEKFSVLEDGEPYCEGIVFHVSDIQ